MKYFHYIIIYAISLLLFTSAKSQISTDRNFVIKNDIKAPNNKVQADVDALTIAGRLQNISYIDGLGRPLQTIFVQGSATGKDLVSPIEYDGLGRETKKFLPYAPTATTYGALQPNVFADQTYFYGTANSSANAISADDRPFSLAIFETSPLNRILQQGAPGETWQPGGGHTVQLSSQVNTAAEAIILWTIGYNAGDLPVNSGIYTGNDLYKMITTDEQGNQSIEYKDREGKIILKKVQLASQPGIDHTGWLCTYYVYDDFNNLRFVIPPKAELLLAGTALSQFSDELCFRYEYDERHRMVVKKVPGAGEVYMVYDNRDRLVFTQDANMRTQNQWLTTLYDVEDRPNMTAMINYSGSRTDLQTYVNANTGTGNRTTVTATNPIPLTLSFANRETGRTVYEASSNISFNPGFSSESGANFTAFIGGGGSTEIVNVVDNPLPPGTNLIALTITYYDDYTWTNKVFDITPNSNSKLYVGNNLNAETLPASTAAQQLISTRGMVTGTKVRVIEDPSNLAIGIMLGTANFYDAKARSLQSQADNYKGGNDITTELYDFSNKILSSYVLQNNPAAANGKRGVRTSSEYDAAGRVTSVTKAIFDNDGSIFSPMIMIAENSYNELGQLKTKALNPFFNSGAGLEKQAFEYNIRGWLLGMNRDYARDANNSNYFGFDLGYDQMNNNLIGNQQYANAQYNGNITGMVWKSKGDQEKRKYDFTYDAVNRLTKADFNQYAGSGFDRSAGIDFSVTNLSYDANGNILTMNQNGSKLGVSSTIDQLTYTYIPNSNKLQNVKDGDNDPGTLLGDFRTSTLHPQSSAKQAAVSLQDLAGITDYTYDVNGNLTKDLNKDIGNASTNGIIYNHLNLPWQVTIKTATGNKGTITYIYDAAGNKLEKKVIENAAAYNNNIAKTTITDYIDGFVYENNAIQFFAQEEGRIRIPNTTNPGAYIFDYFIKDHLGNIRSVLTDEQKQDAYPAATMEPANAPTETNYYSKITETSTAINTIPGYPTTDNYTNPNAYVSEVDGSANKNGPGITLKVMAGDKFNIRVSSWWQSNSAPAQPNSSNPPLQDLLSTIAGGISGIAGIHFSALDIQNSAALSPAITNFLSVQNNNTAGNKPKAFLNWILFDEQFKFVQSSSGVDPVGGSGEFTIHTKTDLPVDKNGYLYIYVSNETPNIPVYYDNLQVTQTRGPLLEETHYYPFGLTMAGISSESAGSLENKRNKFQGQEFAHKEFSDGNGLEMYEFKYRMDDPQTGRFWQIDPLSVKYVYNSTYAFSENKVTSHIELEGAEAIEFMVNFIVDQLTDLKSGTDRFKNNLREGTAAANNNYGRIDESNGSAGVQAQMESFKATVETKKGELYDQTATALDKSVKFASTPFLLASPELGYLSSGLDATNGNYSGAAIDLITLGAGGVLRYLPKFEIPNLNIVTKEGFLFGGIKINAPFNIPVQRFGASMRIDGAAQAWGIGVGNSKVVARTLFAIKPAWNDLKIFTRGVIPKGTPMTFGIVGPQGIRPGGLLQFNLNSSKVVNQVSNFSL